MLEKYWKSQGKVREFCQSGKVGTLVSVLKLLLYFRGVNYGFRYIIFNNCFKLQH